MSERLPVRKTYKLFIGGAFVRSESGRYDKAGEFNIPRGSRKDVRDAVAAARKAQPGWAGRLATGRHRVAQVLARGARDVAVVVAVVAPRLRAHERAADEQLVRLPDRQALAHGATRR